MSIKHNRCTALAKHNYSPARNSFALRTARPYFSLQASKHVPRLLYTPDAVSSVQAAADKLVAIYPYRVADKREEVLKLVEEYPELLLRIPLYCQDRIQTVEDLPVDLQNRILKNYC